MVDLLNGNAGPPDPYGRFELGIYENGTWKPVPNLPLTRWVSSAKVTYDSSFSGGKKDTSFTPSNPVHGQGQFTLETLEDFPLADLDTLKQSIRVYGGYNNPATGRPWFEYPMGIFDLTEPDQEWYEPGAEMAITALDITNRAALTSFISDFVVFGGHRLTDAVVWMLTMDKLPLGQLNGTGATPDVHWNPLLPDAGPAFTSDSLNIPPSATTVNFDVAFTDQTTKIDAIDQMLAICRMWPIWLNDTPSGTFIASNFMPFWTTTKPVSKWSIKGDGTSPIATPSHLSLPSQGDFANIVKCVCSGTVPYASVSYNTGNNPLSIGNWGRAVQKTIRDQACDLMLSQANLDDYCIMQLQLAARGVEQYEVSIPLNPLLQVHDFVDVDVADAYGRVIVRATTTNPMEITIISHDFDTLMTTLTLTRVVPVS